VGRSKEALAIASEVHELDPGFVLGRSIYAWTLYDVHIRGSKTLDAEVLKAAQTIVDLTNDDRAYEPTSAFAITVLYVAKLWADAQRDLRVLEWLDKLDVARLPVDPGKGVDSKGRDQEFASRKERYYSLRSHSLERLGRWKECLETATRALSECGRLHHDNEIWFKRRIALAKQSLGDSKEALVELQQLAERKDASFIHIDIATAAWDAGDHVSTYKHALLALCTPQDIGFKLEAVRLLAEVLWERGEKEHARNHLSLCLAVRKARGWKQSDGLAKLAKSWGVSEPLRESDAILRELQPLWEQWTEDLTPKTEDLTPKMTGTIMKILPNGHAGFIRGDDRADFYFNIRDWKDRRSRPTEGTRVTFATKSSFDSRRQRSTIVACDVRPTVKHVTRN
jgi:tetratricopeptide (TPR) repeat protein